MAVWGPNGLFFWDGKFFKNYFGVIKLKKLLFSVLPLIIAFVFDPNPGSLWGPNGLFCLAKN